MALVFDIFAWFALAFGLIMLVVREQVIRDLQNEALEVLYDFQQRRNDPCEIQAIRSQIGKNRAHQSWKCNSGSGADIDPESNEPNEVRLKRALSRLVGRGDVSCTSIGKDANTYTLIRQPRFQTA